MKEKSPQEIKKKPDEYYGKFSPLNRTIYK